MLYFKINYLKFTFLLNFTDKIEFAFNYLWRQEMETDTGPDEVTLEMRINVLTYLLSLFLINTVLTIPLFK